MWAGVGFYQAGICETTFRRSPCEHRRAGAITDEASAPQLNRCRFIEPSRNHAGFRLILRAGSRKIRPFCISVLDSRR
jgi:hypothetical protein